MYFGKWEKRNENPPQYRPYSSGVRVGILLGFFNLIAFLGLVVAQGKFFGDDSFVFFALGLMTMLVVPVGYLLVLRSRRASSNFDHEYSTSIQRSEDLTPKVLQPESRIDIGEMYNVGDAVGKESEKNFLLDSLDESVILLVLDSSGEFLSANEKFYRFYGEDEESFRQSKFGKLENYANVYSYGSMVLEQDEYSRDLESVIADERKLFWDELSLGRKWRGEMRFTFRLFTHSWLEISAFPLMERNQLKKIFLVGYDITQKKTVEEVILQSSETARQAVSRLEKAEEIGRIGSWEFSSGMSEFKISNGFLKLVDWPEGSLMDFSDYLRMVDPEDKEILLGAIDQAQFASAEFSCSYRITSFGNRKMQWHHAVGHPIQKLKNSHTKFVVVVQDVTEKVKSDQNLLQLTSNAEEATQTKARFLANMSHEIRTPMNGIIGMTELLLSDVKDSAHIEKLQVISNCGKSLLELINEILDFSKIEAGKLELEKEPFNLKGSVRDIVSLMNPVAMKKGIKVIFESDESVPPWIKGDVTRFKQVLNNLLSNAIKFTEKSCVTVNSSAHKISDQMYEIEFSVTDTGVGIPDEVKNKLFQSFSQVDASTTRKFGGTGLGLAITKGICEKMGGKIWVDSKAGIGSTFTFSFLGEYCEAMEDNNEVDPFSVSDSKRPTIPVSILVAEDNIVNQMVIRGFLAKLGYEISISSDGAEALEMLKTQNFDLVLLDCHMPVMDGFETAQNIVNGYSESDRPLIYAVTASTMKEDVDKCIQSGMNGVLGKPLSVREIQKVLDECKIRKSKKQGVLIAELDKIEQIPGSSRAHEQSTTKQKSFNEEKLREYFVNVKDVAEEAVLSFVESSEFYIEDIETQVQIRDFKKALQFTSSLRGSLTSFFADSVDSVAQDFEDCVRQCMLNKDNNAETEKYIELKKSGMILRKEVERLTCELSDYIQISRPAA